MGQFGKDLADGALRDPQGLGHLDGAEGKAIREPEAIRLIGKAIKMIKEIKNPQWAALIAY